MKFLLFRHAFLSVFQFQGNSSIIEWKMFKKAVIEKHGKLHGALGEELSHALQLREYSERAHARTKAKWKEWMSSSLWIEETRTAVSGAGAS